MLRFLCLEVWNICCLRPFFKGKFKKFNFENTHSCGLPLSMGFEFLFIFLLWKKFFHNIFFFFFLSKCFVQGSQYHTRSYFSLIKGTKYFSIVQHRCTVARLSLFLLFYTIYKVISLWKFFISPELSTYKRIKVKTIK